MNHSRSASSFIKLFSTTNVPILSTPPKPEPADTFVANIEKRDSTSKDDDPLLTNTTTESKMSKFSKRVKKAISFGSIKSAVSGNESNSSADSEDSVEVGAGPGPQSKVTAIPITQISKIKTMIPSHFSLVSNASSTNSAKYSKYSKTSNVSSVNDSAVARIKNEYQRLRQKLIESEYYAIFRGLLDNAKYQVLAVALAQGLVFASIFYIQLIVLNTTISSIRLYNLIHVMLSFQGKILLMFGWELASLVRKGFAAVEIQAHKRGVRLTEVSNVDPASCRGVNRIFLFCLIAVEAALWTLSFFIGWLPVNTTLGLFGCTLPTYNQPFEFTHDLGTWVGAQVDWGVLEVFGLPLAQGILGGQAAIPNSAPNRNFQMTGPGVGFLVNSVCTDAVVSGEAPVSSTGIQILTSEYWNQLYTVAFEITLPAESHNIHEYKFQDLKQYCQVTVVAGTVDITFAYTTDEWGVISPRAIQEINVNKNMPITALNSESTDFGKIHHAFGKTELLHENITLWISKGVEMAMNSTNIKNVNTRTAVASMLQWGSDGSGLYDPSATWKAVAGAVAIIGHYVLNLSDGTSLSFCEYKGVAGWGQITAPDWIETILTVILICAITMEVIVVASWLLVVGGGIHIDKCVAMIDNPLRTIYYMRGGLESVVTKIRGNDIGLISLLQHFERVSIRFGEDKKTRGNDVGTLIVDDPVKVVKISRLRKVIVDFAQIPSYSTRRAPPTLGNRPVRLFDLYYLVTSLGGYDQIQDQKWHELASNLLKGIVPPIFATHLRELYKVYLLEFERIVRQAEFEAETAAALVVVNPPIVSNAVVDLAPVAVIPPVHVVEKEAIQEQNIETGSIGAVDVALVSADENAEVRENDGEGSVNTNYEEEFIDVEENSEIIDVVGEEEDRDQDYECTTPWLTTPDKPGDLSTGESTDKDAYWEIEKILGHATNPL
ncbi:UNVERIFIED_CONTAM: hypothetical protein HDU68_012293 [Siphonaria sp. JEL0065]|nr:hypothetical protein HDU68_012293 [Siphonaria sp. JEL0065]